MGSYDLGTIDVSPAAPQMGAIDLVHEGVVMMGAEEARQIIKNVQGRLAYTRRELLEMHDREGWRALGYSSWGACVKAEFAESAESAATLYRQLDAAMIERDVLQDSQLENPSPIPTKQLQAVKQLAPAQRAEAFKRADQLAGDKPRTAKHVAQAAKEIEQPDLPPEYDIIKRRYAAHDHVLSATWDGVTRRYVVRKESGTGVVMLWPDVLSKLERLEDSPLPDPAAVRFRMTCPTCGEVLMNGVWGDLKECGSCYHARGQAPAAPTLADLDNVLPADLHKAGYYWHSATPPTIALNGSQWRGDGQTVEQAIGVAHDHLRAAGEPITVFPALNQKECRALIREAKDFIERGIGTNYPTIAKSLRIAARMALEATE